MKQLSILFAAMLPLSFNAQVIKPTRPVTVLTKQTSRDTVPARSGSKPPTTVKTQPPVVTGNKPITSPPPASVIADMLPPANLKWYAYYQASDPDVNPAVWVYDYYLGEKKYLLNTGQTPEWQCDFIWTNIPAAATAARFEISSLPFPLTDEKNFTGIIDTRFIQKTKPDSLKFSVSYKEKISAGAAPSRSGSMPLLKKTGSVTFAGTKSVVSALTNYGVFYVRLIPLDANGKQTGRPGNSIKIIPDIINFPKPPVPTSEDSLMSDYEITSVKYTQMHYPELPYSQCVVVTGYNENFNTGPLGSTWSNQLIAQFKSAFPVGTIICPSPPKEESWYEKAFNTVTDAAKIAINGASKVYNETKGYLKTKFSEYLCNYDPVVSTNKKLLEKTGASKKTIDDGCNTAAGVVFETAMMYAGMPPSIPNYEEMCRMAKGQVMDLMIQKASEETGMPCDDNCKELIKKGYDKMVEESAAKNIHSGGFFNYKADPRGQYRLPYVEIEITRKRKTQRIDTVVAGLYFTPGVTKTLNLYDKAKQSYTKTVNSYDLYEKIQLPIPYLKNVGDKIKLVAVLTPKFAYANFNCNSGRLENIDTRQHLCGGINVIETGDDPKNSSGYSMMVDNATINVNPSGKIKLASGVNTVFPHHQ